MTRSERRKVAYENFKKKKMESTTICALSALFIENCSDCENCHKQTMSLTSEKWICKKKARQPMIVSNNKQIGMIKNLPYGDLNGKCDFFTFIAMMNE